MIKDDDTVCGKTAGGHISWYDYPPLQASSGVNTFQPVTKDEIGGGSTPDQYGIPEGATDLQDLIEYRGMNFAVGNMFKACYRLGTKNDDLYELNKIKWFVEREIKRLS